MPVTAVTFYVKSAVFNGTTYDSTNGGPVRVDLSIGGKPLTEWAGDAFWPVLAVSHSGRAQARVFLKDVKRTEAPNTKSSLVLTLTGKAANTTLTLANMVYIGTEQLNQTRAGAGECAMVFEHESADGTTFPLT